MVKSRVESVVKRRLISLVLFSLLSLWSRDENGGNRLRGRDGW